MVDKALGWIRQLTEVGLAIIALGVVLQIIFGAAVPVSYTHLTLPTKA